MDSIIMFVVLIFILLLTFLVFGSFVIYKKMISVINTYNVNNELRFQKEFQELKNFCEKKVDTSLINTSTHLISTNSARLKEILDPLKEKLNDFKERNEVIHESQTQQVSGLRSSLNHMLAAQVKLADEANKLSNSLRSQVKLQGMWGEDILKQLLERSGLKKGISYEEQVSYKSEGEKIKRPDFIINLPDNKKIVIDAKLSLNSYVEYSNATSEAEKKIHLESIRKNIKNHINNLSSKEYNNIEGINSIDGVLLFIPLESLLFTIINHLGELFLEASSKKIYIVSSTLLLPLLQIIGSIWKTHNQSQNTLEMANIAGKIYDKCAGILSDFDAMQECINKADKQLNSIKIKLTGRDNLVRNAKRLMNLGANTSKHMPKSWENKVDDLDEVLVSTDAQIKETLLVDHKVTDKGV